MRDSGTIVGRFVQVGGDSLDEDYPGRGVGNVERR